MRTMSPRVENGKIDVIVRSAIRTPREIVVPAAIRTVRRFIPERWVVDLLLLATAAMVIAVTALGGLAVVSTWAPSDQAGAGRKICGRHDVESVDAEPIGFVVCSDARCCREVQ